MMEVRHLRGFCALAETLHFGRAAERIGIAQPALSRQIQQLELVRGCRLVERDTRTTNLTPAGRVLYERGRRLLAQWVDSVRAVEEAAAGRSGRLRIGVSGSAIWTVLPSVLSRIRESLPALTLDVRELPTSDQIGRLEARELDVGFFLESDIPAEITTTEVARERGCFGLPAGHPLASRRTLSFGDIAGERLILFPRDRNPALYDRLVDAVRPHARHGIPDVVEASSRQVAAGMVAAGLGVSTFSASMDRLCGPGVRLVPIADRGHDAVLVMGWLRDGRNPIADAAVGASRSRRGS